MSDVPTYYHQGARGPEANFLRDDYLDWIAREHPDAWRLAVHEGLPEDQAPITNEAWTSALPQELHQSHWIVDQTIGFIDRHQREPWFAWCSFVDPHHPFNAPQAFRDRYDPATFAEPMWDDREFERRSRWHHQRLQEQGGPRQEHWREYRAQYYGMISLIDDEIGRLLAYLEEHDLTRNTVIVFTADHGEMLGDHGLPRKGLFHYEPLIRVPLAFAWSGHVPAGRRVDGIAQTVEATVTMLDLVGSPIPPQMQGFSLAPWLYGDRLDSPRDAALVTNGGEGLHYDPWPELWTLVTDNWKLQYGVHDGFIDLDHLGEDPHEIAPRDPDDYPEVVQRLLCRLVDAGSDASSMREVQTGRW